jgi:EAL domain-containing protein (putative c-di-GMP-specific phosphodiesterase class I)
MTLVTGSSSLSHLKRLPTSLIKIDPSFVRGMLEGADDLAIVEGVIALAKSFQREVIIEGVKTIEYYTPLNRHLLIGITAKKQMYNL